jgi:hypothetical protein
MPNVGGAVERLSDGGALSERRFRVGRLGEVESLVVEMVVVGWVWWSVVVGVG